MTAALFFNEPTELIICSVIQQRKLFMSWKVLVKKTEFR